MDLVLKLREIRRMRGLSQKDVARMSGVGEKTISSFETGQRIGSLKIAQLRRLLGVYGLTEAEFFGGTVEKQIAPWELNEEEFATTRLNRSNRRSVSADSPLSSAICSEFSRTRTRLKRKSASNRCWLKLRVTSGQPIRWVRMVPSTE